VSRRDGRTSGHGDVKATGHGWRCPGGSSGHDEGRLHA